MRRKRGDPFQVFVRREAGYGLNVAVRFEVFEGRGTLTLGTRGRQDRKPVSDYEESEVAAEVLRAGRFVHVLSDGSRRSYALSRVTAEKLGRISSETWTQLTAVTEFGFRYMDLPAEVLETSAATAAVVVAAAPIEAKPRPVASVTPRTPPAAVATESTPPALDQSLPPRGVSVAAPLADTLFDTMSKDQAVEALRAEMAKVETLHLQNAALKKQLDASASREMDLVMLLDRWRKRELE